MRDSDSAYSRRLSRLSRSHRSANRDKRDKCHECHVCHAQHICIALEALGALNMVANDPNPRTEAFDRGPNRRGMRPTHINTLAAALERAWDQALPGREVAERNALLCAAQYEARPRVRQ